MKLDISYLVSAPSKRLSYRRPWPKELLPFLTGTELKRSLKAADIDAPGAMDRYRKAAAEYERLTAEARKRASGAFDELTDELIEFLAKTYPGVELAQDDAVRWGRPSDSPRPYLSRASLEEDYDRSRELLEAYDTAGLVAHWGEWVAQFALVYGAFVDVRTERFMILCTRMAESACGLWISLEDRTGMYGSPVSIETPTLPKRPSGAASGKSAKEVTTSSRTFEDIAEQLLESPHEAVGTSTKQAARTALRFLRDAHGSLKPHELTRALVGEWLDLLARKPAKTSYSERTMPLRPLIEKYRDSTCERLSAKTRNTLLAALATLWRKAQEVGLIDYESHNPFVRRKAAAGTRSKKPKGFSSAELRAIFKLPVFTEGERPTRGRGEASYWIPLLLLWTGARPEEIAQLTVGDFGRDAETDRLTMTITDEGDHPVKGHQLLKTSKNGSGRRTFPVPKALIDLGLLAYIEWLKSNGETALFPKLTMPSARGELFASFGPWWSYYMRHHGALEVGNARQPAREFRHTWTTAARASKVPQDAREYLQGHVAPNASSNDVYGDKSPHADWIDILELRIDLSGVLPWQLPKDT